MVSNTGTYLDTPFHRYADGTDLSGLVARLDRGPPRSMRRARRWARRSRRGRCGLRRARGARPRGASCEHETGIRHWRGGSVLRGLSLPHRVWSALYLRDAGAALVGIDSHNIDDTSAGTRPVHSTLLRAGIPIVEHMTQSRGAPVPRPSASPPSHQEPSGMGTVSGATHSARRSVSAQRIDRGALLRHIAA